MLQRIRRHLEILSVFVLASFCFFFLFRNREHSIVMRSSNVANVTELEGLQDGLADCHCSPCEFQQPEPEVMEWDSSRVLRGSPTERFRGMLSLQHF